MYVLGIETSCDETGVAIYHPEEGIVAEALYSQIATHAEYGGVVPELASRDHVRKLLPMVTELLETAAIPKLEGIAYTAGPGLVGALMVGAGFAKSLAYGWQLPAIGVHHMEAHCLAPLIENPHLSLPFVALLVSGGHTQLVLVKTLGEYELLGETIDDAAGEAFDKVAKMMSLPYPGGPHIAKLAEKGDTARFRFPRPMTDRPGLDMSFSGLKTQVRNQLQSLVQEGSDNAENLLDEQDKADVAACFQEAVVGTLVIKCRRALQETGCKQLVIAGGVSANQRLREALASALEKLSANVFYASPRLCTDNGVMVAYVGCLRLMAGDRESLSIQCRPRWPMTELTSISA